MIAFSHISKKYDETQALRNISFEVAKGELFGLIGPDGAGKSSAMRMLVTLLLPDEGTITIEGKDVVDDYKTIRKHVGYMPGDFSLYQDLTVEENLKFFARVFNTTVKENYALIEHIYSQLEPFKNRRAGALSGGMKQKLALCCALIHKPKFLVLDEPTTGVDAVSRKEFWDMLARLKEHDITIVVSTPYLEEASLCDRVGLLNNGELMQIDSPENIISGFSKSLLGVQSPNNYQLLKDLRTLDLNASIYPYKDKVRLALPADYSREQLSELLVKHGIDVSSVTNESPEIEDCFMDLMLQNQ